MDCSKIERINSFMENLSINESFIHPNIYIFDNKLKIYEDEMHEFKNYVFSNESEVSDKIRQLVKYFVAFLNSNSGVLYIGVNDDGYVKGTKLSRILMKRIEDELNQVINSFEDHVMENNLIMYQFCPVHDPFSNIIIKDLYVIEILVKQGLANHVYTTPFKDNKTNDYQCYIKLNGTTNKIEGPNLYKYLKNKIKNYLKNNKKNL